MANFYYSAIATNATGNDCKENLDNVDELNAFAEKMQIRGYLNLVVGFYNCEGLAGHKELIFNGENWDVIRQVRADK